MVEIVALQERVALQTARRGEIKMHLLLRV